MRNVWEAEKTRDKGKWKEKRIDEHVVMKKC